MAFLSRGAAISVLLATALGAVAEAQQPRGRRTRAESRRPQSAPGGTVVGVVLDTGGVPIDSTEVRIAILQRRTFTDASGVFRFADLKPGAYDISVRRLGFAPQVRRVTVGNDYGASATFTLVTVGYVLPPVVTSSVRGGLSGVIGDTAFNALSGADVYVVGGGRRATTDSAGTFFIDVKPGSYMVQVSLPGFARKLLSVSISADSGRHISVWMVPAKRAADRREAEAIQELRSRFMIRRATARFYTREELSRYDFEWLKQLVVMASGMPVADDCQALLDGLWRRPLYSLTLDDAESVEVYPPGSIPSSTGSLLRSKPPRSIDARGTQQTLFGPACPAVFVWMRD